MSEFWDKFTVVEPGRQDLGGNCRYGDHRSITPRLWQHFIDRFGIQSMLDVGSGEGHAARYFFRQGVIAHAIDGAPSNINRSRFPAALHDLTTGPYMFPCDLVLCVETIEHIGSKFETHVLDTLCNADIVAMTHALPGQSGYHHVNCRPEEYWVSEMNERGYMLALENEEYRQLAVEEVSDAYFAETGLVFLRAS